MKFTRNFRNITSSFCHYERSEESQPLIRFFISLRSIQIDIFNLFREIVILNAVKNPENSRTMSWILRLWLRMTVSLCVLFLLSLCSNPVFAQQNSNIENLLESVSQQSDVSSDLDALEFYFLHPVYFRTASVAELASIPGITLSHARNFVELRNKSPEIGFSALIDSLFLPKEQAEILRQCISADEPIKLGTKSKIFSYRTRTRERLNSISAFSDGTFSGSSLELYQRLNYFDEKNEAQIIATKSAGEISVADFLSGYFRTEMNETKIIVGDFTVKSGLGTSLWSTFSARKGADVISPAVQNAFGFQPYRSTIEAQFFRGISAQKTFSTSENSKINAVVWISSLPRAATIDSGQNIATSLDASGYFRTPTEIAKRNDLKEQTFGSAVEFFGENLRIGANAFFLRYDKPVESASQTAFVGQSGLISSIYGAGQIEKINLQGEISRDAENNFGGKIALHANEKYFEEVLAFRSFSAKMREPFGGNFGESGEPSNETGIYAGFLWKQSQKLQLSFYADLYHTLAPTYYVPMPVRGIDLFGETKITLQSKTSVNVRLHYENKTDALTIPDEFNRDERILYDKTHIGLRFQVNHSISQAIQTRFHFETTFLTFAGLKPNETGILSYADVHWRRKSDLGIYARLVYFSTDSYDSAIWEYEHSMPGTMSNPALYGKGMRIATLIDYSPISSLTFWLQGFLTVKNGVSSMGSGYFEIVGNTESQLLLQMELHF